MKKSTGQIKALVNSPWRQEIKKELVEDLQRLDKNILETFKPQRNEKVHTFYDLMKIHRGILKTFIDLPELLIDSDFTDINDKINSYYEKELE